MSELWLPSSHDDHGSGAFVAIIEADEGETRANVADSCTRGFTDRAALLVLLRQACEAVAVFRDRPPVMPSQKALLAALAMAPISAEMKRTIEARLKRCSFAIGLSNVFRAVGEDEAWYPSLAPVPLCELERLWGLLSFTSPYGVESAGQAVIEAEIMQRYLRGSESASGALSLSQAPMDKGWAHVGRDDAWLHVSLDANFAFFRACLTIPFMGLIAASGLANLWSERALETFATVSREDVLEALRRLFDGVGSFGTLLPNVRISDPIVAELFGVGPGTTKLATRSHPVFDDRHRRLELAHMCGHRHHPTLSAFYGHLDTVRRFVEPMAPHPGRADVVTTAFINSVVTTSDMDNAELKAEYVRIGKFVDCVRGVCIAAARGGHLPILHWLARYDAEHAIFCDAAALRAAAEGGHAHCVRFVLGKLTARGVKLKEGGDLLEQAAGGGSVECVLALLPYDKKGFDSRKTDAATRARRWKAVITAGPEMLAVLLDAGMLAPKYACKLAAENGAHGSLRVLRERGYHCSEVVCNIAINAASLECLRVLRLGDNPCPWAAGCLLGAIRRYRKNPAILRFCLENGCPRGENPDALYARALQREVGLEIVGPQWPVITELLDHGVPLSHDASVSLAGTATWNRERSVLIHLKLAPVGFTWGPDHVQVIAHNLRGNDGDGERAPCLDMCTGTNAVGLSPSDLVRHCMQRVTEGHPLPLGALELLITTLRTQVDNDLRCEAMSYAALMGEKGTMVKLRDSECPWDARTVTRAATRCNSECLAFAIDNGCPFDSDRTIKTILAEFNKAVKGQAQAEAVMVAGQNSRQQRKRGVKGGVRFGDHLDTLRYLMVERGIASWTEITRNVAEGVCAELDNAGGELFGTAVETLEASSSAVRGHRSQDIAGKLFRTAARALRKTVKETMGSGDMGSD